ncbi:MAG TPA: carboxypeptidase regulatory-like domain-containing protein [Pseudomonadota bacterium]|nr:carboxypeptidase regulatory-like domain-containing protein [Pseudomonadota bacterium]
MHTHREPLLRTLALVGSLLVTGPFGLLGQSPAQAEPAGGDPRVKYLYKAVPCTPCPCECPDSRGREPSVPPPVPAVVSPPPVSGSTGTEPEGAGPAPAQVRPSAPVAKPVEQARGSIGGVVVLRDRTGKEKSDRSDVLVYLEQVPRKYQALRKPRAMAQREKSFVPKLLAVTKGSTVDFPNEDKFFHNVFSLSEGNTFDLGLYRSGESKPMVFEKTGVVDVYCNIHPNMWAQILVLDNPFYTTPGGDGTFELSKVPPGTYSVAAFVIGTSSPVRQQVKVEPGKRAELRLEVKEGAANRPHMNKFNQPYDRYK